MKREGEIEQVIPRGTSRDDMRTRKQIIGDFYVRWIAANPEKRVWNKSLNSYINVKFISINETKGQASVSDESTRAVMGLSDILKNAVVVNRKAAKTNDRNQKAFDKMIIMSYKEFRLLVGHQTSKNEYVQYCITAKK